MDVLVFRNAETRSNDILTISQPLRPLPGLDFNLLGLPLLRSEKTFGSIFDPSEIRSPSVMLYDRLAGRIGERDFQFLLMGFLCDEFGSWGLEEFT